jgi:Ala-tRNA(Pro) deacylase
MEVLVKAMKVPSRLTEFLKQSGVKYRLIHHPVAYTAQELAAIEHVKGRQHAKVVVVKAGNEYVMLVLPADHRIELERVAEVTGQAATLATEDELRTLFPDCEPGTMAPFGHLYGLRTLVDESLVSAGNIVFEAGTHADAVRMEYADYERLARPILRKYAIKYH